MHSGPTTFEQVVARATTFASDVPFRWGTTLVVAPHPDDESLGCGGAIALLRQLKQMVHVLFVSDGSMSHPNSQKYAAEARRTLREREAQNALAHLGVAPSEITFLRLPDTLVPTEQAALFGETAARIHHYLQRIRPRTVLVPWRRDPHGDHRATWQLLRTAVDRSEHPIQRLEYPVWVWESTQPEDFPTAADGTWCKLDITKTLPQKRRAIAEHVSQTTSLIDDDPEGFTLSQQMISHFTQPYEYYLEP